MTLVNQSKPKPKISYRRDWSRYRKEDLEMELAKIRMDFIIEDVQSKWNKHQRLGF